MKMNSTKGSARARLLTSTLLAGLATVAAPLAVTAIATAVPTLASAQDYTSGTMLGTVRDSSGAPVADATVVVKSLAQGFERTVTTDAQGQFRVALVPIGGYSVAITKEGYQSTSDGNVRVGLGGSTGYTFTLASASESVSEVIVTATANPQLDFAATTKGLTVDLETLTKQVPIARNITAVTLLAPSVVTGSSAIDSTFANQPSVGGASIAENAFYVNGLNITNFDTYVGGATVPFDFYKTVEVKTGGYPAEFGRATGGVISTVTKSGSNEFKFGLHGNWAPDSLRNESPNTYTTDNSMRRVEQRDVTVEIGGPIIEDRLFFYVLNQQRDNRTKQASITNREYLIDKANDPFWGGKLDAVITDRQRVEFTWFDSSSTTVRSTYGFTPATKAVGAKVGETLFDTGGESYVAKYTGQLTDWFTLSAAYGVSKDADSTTPSDASMPYVIDTRSGTALRFGPQISSNGVVEVLNTKREFYRLDGDLYFSLLGDHHVRFGYDNEKTDLLHTSMRTGGQRYTYRNGSARDSRGVPAGTQYIEVQTANFGGAVEGQNYAYYIQDSWDVTPQINLQLGLRNDAFTLDNLQGERVVTLKNNWGPRLGLTWDPTGDGTNKVYASYGRYYVPPASNLGFRGADLFFSEFYNAPVGGFTYNADGTPALFGSQITQATNPGFSGAAPCPAGGLGAAGVNGCVVTGDGSQEASISKTVKDLKPTTEDEFIIGYQRQFNELWSGNVSLTYRNLSDVSEDIAIDAAVLSYCTAQGIAGCEDIWTGFHQYVIGNPGEDMKVTLRDPVAGETSLRTVSLSADALGYPKAKREYVALEMSFERKFDGKWGLQGSYVLSESKGNYEGTVKSENGQTDAGTTTDFDQPGLVDGAYGLLPNHRGHQIKLFGSYAITDNLLVGSNIQVISGRHSSCLGVHPTDAFAQGYGVASYFCQGQAIPRGTAFKTDWTSKIDLSVRYTVPAFAFVPQGLTLRADVFNVLNADTVTAYRENGDLASGAIDPNYRKPVAYQEPRYVRFGFDLEF
jgi:outer membrane receptor protein involved in Fe transport